MEDKSEDGSKEGGESGSWVGELGDTLSPSAASLGPDSFTWKQNTGSKRTPHSLNLQPCQVRFLAGLESSMQPFRTLKDAGGG